MDFTYNFYLSEKVTGSVQKKFGHNFLFGRIVAPTVTLQGNLDPACLYSSHVSDCLSQYFKVFFYPMSYL